jgi:glycosyl hydrolase family 39 (putative alpha-L-iduronidase)
VGAVRAVDGVDDFLQRLAGDVGLRTKLQLTRTAGSPVIVQLEMMPSWLTSAPGNNSLPCFWTDSEANLLKLYERTARAVKRANPAARIGGPGSVDPAGLIEPSTTPLVQALIEHAANTGAPLDFVSYHLFGFTPHRAAERPARLSHALPAR